MDGEGREVKVVGRCWLFYYYYGVKSVITSYPTQLQVVG
jgi:hypothetical protein